MSTTIRPSRTICVVGPFPPPHGGAAKNTARILNDLREAGLSPTALRTNPIAKSAHAVGLRHLGRKTVLSLKNAIRLLLFRASGTTVYIVPDGGTGVWFSALYVAVLRLRCHRDVIVHFRNAPLVMRYNLAIKFVVRLMEGRATYVFLDEGMRDAFLENYSSSVDYLIVNNAATNDVPEGIRARSAAHLRIGYLSNLNAEKGFDIVCSAFEAVAKWEPDLEFWIAGAPTDGDAKAALDRLTERLGSRLRYWGELRGTAKAEFFAQLDLFVFPTRFRQEAQPNVIYEALAAGVSVIATRHALIPAMLQGFPHRLVTLDEHTVVRDLSEAIRSEVVVLRSADYRESTRRACQVRYREVREVASHEYNRLLTKLRGDNF